MMSSVTIMKFNKMLYKAVTLSVQIRFCFYKITVNIFEGNH